MIRFPFQSQFGLFLAFLMGTAKAADLSKQEMATGKRLYTTKCARCHKFYDTKAYTDTEWEEWMGKMRRKARLNDQQYETLSRYLDSLRKEPGSTVEAVPPN